MAVSKLSISEDGSNIERGLCTMQRLQKRYVVFVIIILLACIGLAGYLLVRQFLQPAELNPPNPEQTPPPSSSKLRHFRKGAVCSDARICSKIGRDILSKNGTAVDAAIATLFCNGIYNMHSMGIGGGFLMTIYIREKKKAISLIAREQAPGNASPHMFYRNARAARSGGLAVGVPGELRGYWEAHQRYGSLPWKELIEPAIDLCDRGYNMSIYMRRALDLNSGVKHDPVLRDLLVNKTTGEFLNANTLIRPRQYCKTLRLIAENGANDFYNGTIAKMLLNDIKEMGGIITQEDLINYNVEWVDPIKIQMSKNYTFYSVPPPGSGLLLGFILNILDGYGFTRESIANDNERSVTYHRIIEAFKYAYAKRTELGDVNYVDSIDQLIHNLTSKDYADSIRSLIQSNRTYPDAKHYGAVYYSKEDHGTAHISVLAPNGDAVSVTSTLNMYFGAAASSKSTGILLNSVMDDFSSADFNNYFNLPGSPANSIVPGKRPLSSMCPSIIVDSNDDAKLVIGAAGGTKITTSVAMVIIRYLWFGQSIKEAIDAARIHHQLYPMRFEYEYGILKHVVEKLISFGHETKRHNGGSVVCALTKENNTIVANADYRKNGDVAGID